MRFQLNHRVSKVLMFPSYASRLTITFFGVQNQHYLVKIIIFKVCQQTADRKEEAEIVKPVIENGSALSKWFSNNILSPNPPVTPTPPLKPSKYDFQFGHSTDLNKLFQSLMTFENSKLGFFHG